MKQKVILGALLFCFAAISLSAQQKVNGFTIQRTSISKIKTLKGIGDVSDGTSNTLRLDRNFTTLPWIRDSMFVVLPGNFRGDKITTKTISSFAKSAGLKLVPGTKAVVLGCESRKKKKDCRVISTNGSLKCSPGCSLEPNPKGKGQKILIPVYANSNTRSKSKKK